MKRLNKAIADAERFAAYAFFEKRDKGVFRGTYRLNTDELVAIQILTGLDNENFATSLGLNKATYKVILKRGALNKQLRMLAMIRLRNELEWPGCHKRLLGQR